jgi:hypothetical protein
VLVIAVQFFVDVIRGCSRGSFDQSGPACVGVHGCLLKWDYHFKRQPDYVELAAELAAAGTLPT